MAKPGRHTFPDYDAKVEALAKHLPSAKRDAAAARKRTARESFKATTIFRIKVAIASLQGIIDLFDDLYPI